MAESGLLCVTGATLLRSKDASSMRVMSQYLKSELSGFLFHFQGICLALTPVQAENNGIAVAITIVRTN